MPVYSKEVQGKLKTAPHLEIKLVKCNDLASKDPNGLSDPVSTLSEDSSETLTQTQIVRQIQSGWSQTEERSEEEDA